MTILFLPVILAAFFIAMRVAAFEATFFTILSAPIVAFLIGQLTGSLGSETFYFVLVVQAVAISLFCRSSPAEDFKLREQIFPLVVFCGGYAFFFALNQLWPDFMPMGERLRDYALVNAVIKYPLEAREPWMSGAVLNYYLYWYRFGQMLGAIFGLEPWEVYHRLQAFVCGLYLTCAFVMLRRWLSWRVGYALAAAIVIAIGSNCDGIGDFLAGDTDWWGPSRVVKGAINEFPAWSFLLGDVHPHFLNLPLMPFLILLSLAVWSALRSVADKVVFAICGGLIGFQWISYANAWELPEYLTVIGVLVIFSVLQSRRDTFQEFLIGLRSLRTYPTLRNVAVVLLTALMSLSLYLSTRNIDAGGLEPRWVTSTVGRTPLNEFLLHWGIPLTLILFALVSLLPNWRQRGYAVGLVLVACISGTAWVLLGVIAILAVVRLAQHRSVRMSSEDLVINLALLVGGVLVLSPEVFFFDDAYGGDIERMNTIFKFYSAAWFFLHIAALGLTWEWLRSTFRHYTFIEAPRIIPGIAAAAILIFSTGFFWQTAKIRRSPPCTIYPCDRGLSMLDREKPGAAFAISQLSRMAPGIVLETQGPPYSLTSHVATLSGNESYLGWSNHITLLTRKYDEARRREEVTKQIYSASDCEVVKALLRKERISYLVFGPLEHQAYPAASEANFKCLHTVVKQGDYSVFVD